MKSLCEKHEFESRFFGLVNLRIKFSSSCHIVNQNVFVLAFSNHFLTTRQILNRHNLPKSTICTFHIVFLHINMCNYHPQNFRQLENRIRHRSNSTSCTLSPGDFHFWAHRCVPFFSFVNLPDICRNQMLLLVKLQQLLLFESHAGLTRFLKTNFVIK